MIWSLLRGSCPVVNVSPSLHLHLWKFSSKSPPNSLFLRIHVSVSKPSFHIRGGEPVSISQLCRWPSCFSSFIIPHPEASVHSSSYEQLDHHLFIIIVSRRRRGAALFAEAAQLILALPFSNSLRDPLSFMPVTSLHLGH